jgi:hypothetical protein
MENRGMPSVPDLWSLLSQIVGVAVLLGACLTFAGWAYASDLYDEFGISFRSLDVPVTEYAYYALHVIVNWSGLWVGVAIAGITSVALRLLSGHRTLIIILALAMVFPALYLLGVSKGHEAKLDLSRSGRNIQLYFKESHVPITSAEFTHRNDAGLLKSLTQTKDGVIVFFNEGNEFSIDMYLWSQSLI